MFKTRLTLIAFVLILIGLSSCGRFQKLLKSNDYEEKYAMALEFFENEEYNKTLQLFDQISPIYRGTDKAQKIEFMYAMCHYNQRDYILASYYFKRYYQAYPKTPEAEQALFMSAYSNYLDSPRSSLDQETTVDAIQEMKLFISRFPNSEKVSEGYDLISEMESRLELKAFDMAKLYMKMNDYKAAIASCEAFIKQYQLSDYHEEAMFLIIQANYEYALNSVAFRQEERFSETSEAFVDFVSQFPDSKFLKEAEKMNAVASTYITKNIE
ncbi:MAG: outer membrane protein assembly factor BamD [Bacteroidales bacterium]|jgi:outer membrane protein assembly factor BamD|nr:outer membrane protein assembly factor BamD [Bacteroidales bacterium]